MEIKDLFISYGAGSDKEKPAWEFYQAMNSRVKRINRHGTYMGSSVHKIGGDITFNFEGNLSKRFGLKQSSEPLILFCLSMCYTNLNKSIMPSEGPGRNLNSIKGAPKDLQNLDRGDTFVYIVSEYYEEVDKRQYNLEESLNEYSKNFLSQFDSIDEFVYELYNIKRCYKEKDLYKIVDDYLSEYCKNIKHHKGFYIEDEINNYISSDSKVNNKAMKSTLHEFIKCESNNGEFDLIDSLAKYGKKKLNKETIEGKEDIVDIKVYCKLAIIFWSCRLNYVKHQNTSIQQSVL